jgi:hypothetical protein
MKNKKQKKRTLEDAEQKKRTLTTQEVEMLYSIPAGSLCQLRYLKRGPKYFILGNTDSKRHKVLYFVEDVENWIKSNPVHTVDSANYFNKQ